VFLLDATATGRFALSSCACNPVVQRLVAADRYYLSAALLQGAAAHAGSVRRVPAPEIEALVESLKADLRDECLFRLPVLLR
jgi:hypothetical protein